MTLKSKFSIAIACGVFLIIFGLVGAVLIDGYLQQDIYAAILFMTCVSIAVHIFIRQGIHDSMFQFLIQNQKFIHKQNQDERKDGLYGITMPLSTMIFLIVGFTKNWWHPAWIVFPITVFLTEGILYFINKN